MLSLHKQRQKFLILVPSLILMDQWRQAILEKTKIKVRCFGSNHDRRYVNNGDVYVCVFNSFDLFVESCDDNMIDFAHIYVDEAHHIKKSSGYLASIREFLESDLIEHTLLSATIPHADYTYNMRAAINDGILTDYDITIPVYSNYNKQSLVDLINSHPEYTKVMIYFNRIADAQEFTALAIASKISSKTITCEEPLKSRTHILSDFKSGKYRVISSVNTLGEGVNITCADTCIFGDDRSSEVSIIQCIGRILRKFPGKLLSHVVVPVRVSEITDSTSAVIQTLAKIAKNDIKLNEVLHAAKSSSRIVVVVDASDTATTTDTDIDANLKLTELVYKSVFDIASHGAWDFKYNVFKEYYDINGIPITSTIFKDVKIGSWQNTQRQYLKNNKLSQYQIDKLNAINVEILNPPDNWESVYNVFKEYYDINGIPIRSTIFKDVKIGSWQDTQRQYLKNNKLSQYRIDKLNTLSPDVLKINTNK